MERLLLPTGVLLFGALLYAGLRPVGPVPPLGRFLDPVHGVWAVAAAARFPSRVTAPIPALGDSVDVRYDDRGVPHIFATREADAIRALGYVVARDRLFQLELQTRATEGTLTELFGRQALEVDRAIRAIGLAWSARREYATLDSTSRAATLGRAFAEGVNAFTGDLGRRRLPLEYHLLDARPLRWEPVHSLFLHRRMGYTLSYLRPELQRERAAALVGERAADALFPVQAPIQEPIVPGDRAYPWFDTTALPEPATPAGRGQSHSDGRGRSQTVIAGRPPASALDRPWPPLFDRLWPIGSNNWAVAPARSATGHAILSGDPHLELSLPSIWYEVHLVVPGVLDVYGVTIPGVPGVVIGFNRNVAWSFTNTEADVLDLYVETVDDAASPTRYRLDGEWRPLESRVETYRNAAGDVLATDTIRHTHRGPMLRHDQRWLSMRWTMLEATGGWSGFDRPTRAGNVQQWLEGWADYPGPAQNGIVADREGNIAIRSTGWFPVRPADGRGDVVRDGGTRAVDWIGRWRVAEYPQAINPAQGFLASANQQPFDPRRDARYLGADWYAPWRAMRINALLRVDTAVTVEAMRRYQTDPGSERAELFAPALVEAGRRILRAEPRDTVLATAVRLLAEWDRRYTTDNRRAVLFELAMDALEDRAWDELLDPAGAVGRRVATPAESVLWRLWHDPTSVWWDDRRTERREDRDDIAAASLKAAVALARERHGDPEGDGWRWDRVRHANIYHLLRFPALSALGIAVQGGPGLLNPSSGRGTHGASWRMVVELGDEVSARAIYPGGQSGNPVSPWYDDRIPKWAAGELDSLLFPRTPGDLPEVRTAARLSLVPGR